MTKKCRNIYLHSNIYNKILCINHENLFLNSGLLYISFILIYFLYLDKTILTPLHIILLLESYWIRSNYVYEYLNLSSDTYTILKLSKFMFNFIWCRPSVIKLYITSKRCIPLCKQYIIWDRIMYLETN